MKRQTNNEIDLLLRRLSRRQDAPVSIDADHLDADELSSYAENALPVTARARYTEHLAECSRCRELVVQLSSSVGVVAAAENVSAPSGFKKFLASLFSPMVLRYAIPALGVIVVAVIGFVVMRTNRDSAFVAQLETKTQQAPAAIPSEQPETTESARDSQALRGSRSPVNTPEIQTAKPKEEQPAPAPSATPSASVAAETKADPPAPKAEQPIANAAPAQPAPKPSDTVSEMRDEQEARKQNVQGRAAPASGTGGQSKFEVDQRSADLAAAARSESAKKKAMEPGASTGGVASLRRERADEKDKDDAETRSVAGRRFRKQRGVWVDTAYDPDSSTVNLTRGSEQYRALVADEPAIKRIAEQLDGQIIVVWKGRAYRIR